MRRLRACGHGGSREGGAVTERSHWSIYTQDNPANLESPRLGTTFHAMTRPKRILAGVGGLIILLLALLFMLPLLFRDRIAQRVKAAVNENVNARVDWRDVGLTFFKNFPNLTLTLDDLTTVGVDKFQGDTLAAVRHLRVVLDLASVLGNVMGGRPIVIRAVELDQPRLSLIALEDGTANWDITKKTPAAQPQAGASKPVAISLRRFQL